MTKKENNKATKELIENYHKLSIQVGLNGLSFCVFDTIANSIARSRKIDFGKELTPFEVQKELRDLLQAQGALEYQYSEVVVIHRNDLFSLVPKALFNKNELANYLKFNAKILANDLIEYDEISNYDIVNVYVPFVNLNNYIYELFGAFEFMHSATVLIQALLNLQSTSNEPICYVHAGETYMDIVVISQKQLLFYNSFLHTSKEDFIYYLLFTLEQLKLDTKTVKTRLFGNIEEGDELYEICYDYVQHLSIFVPESSLYPTEDKGSESIDFTVISSL